METQPLCANERALPACSVSAQERREFQLRDISMSVTERRETDDEFELIEMRYQQFLALMNLEDLFAEGQLDCM
jgi:hypothetical protein